MGLLHYTLAILVHPFLYTLMMEPGQLIGAPLFKTNGWAQSSPYPVRPFQEYDTSSLNNADSCLSHHMKASITSFTFHVEDPIVSDMMGKLTLDSHYLLRHQSRY